jgi:hypothetical protein
MSSRHTFFRLSPLLFCIFLLLTFLLSPVSSEARWNKSGRKSSRSRPSGKEVRSEAGLKIPEWGIAIDAIYNPALDNLIPGYKIVHIALTNSRAQEVQLNPASDRWYITDFHDKKHTAINHVKAVSDELWESLPPKLQAKLDYPKVVLSGKLTTIDVLIPSEVDLFNFKEVSWKSAFFKRSFDMYTNYESKIEANTFKNQPIPAPEPVNTDKNQPIKGTALSNRVNEMPQLNQEFKPEISTSFDDAIVLD